MALIAGGGAGNPVGGTAGVGTSLNYVGDFAYAYSGAADAASSSDTRLKFSTGNEIIVGKITGNGACDATSLGDGNITSFTIQVNGETVSVMKVDTSTEDSPMTAVNNLILAPYSEVTVLSQSDGAGTDRVTTVLFTGRVYA
jgi:hypothetical protein